jgi:hypothetical protein
MLHINLHLLTWDLLRVCEFHPNCSYNCLVYAVVQLVEVEELAGSIPDGVIGIFHWHNPSGRTMALGPKEASAYGWLPEHFMCRFLRNSGNLILLETKDPVQAFIGISLVTLWKISSDRLVGFYAGLEDTFISTFRRNVLLPSLV